MKTAPMPQEFGRRPPEELGYPWMNPWTRQEKLRGQDEYGVIWAHANLLDFSGFSRVNTYDL